MHNFVVHSNERVCRKVDFLGWNKSNVELKKELNPQHYNLLLVRQDTLAVH